MKRNTIRTGGLVVIMMAVLFTTGCARMSAKHIDKGIQYYNKNEYSKALDCFSKAVKADKSAENYAYMALAQIELGEYEEAKQSLDEALSLKSSDISALRGMGVLKLKQGLEQEAAEEFEKIKNQGRSNSPEYIDAMKHYAAILYNEKKYSEAIELYNELIGIGSKSDMEDLYFGRGSALAMNHMENEAVLDYEKALEYSDSTYEIYYSMYCVMMEAEYFERAESFLRRLLNENRDTFLAGKTYYLLGEYEKARENLTAAYNEGNEKAIEYLALTYQKLNMLNQVDELYTGYMDRNGETADLCNQYGVFLINAGRYDEAKTQLDRALELAKNTDEIYDTIIYNIAVNYEHMGDLMSALDRFYEYIDRCPDDLNARKEITYLESRM
ncbi:MAG: hypothetical protein PUA49_02200 [Butyrivibrio sp.]|nr:hypothetical protein [Butyrivibrio sp.]